MGSIKRKMAGYRLGFLLCALFACHEALAMTESESVTMLEGKRKSGDNRLPSNELKPDEANSAEKIATFKDMKKYIYKEENEVLDGEMSKADDEESEEIAIGDTLKSMEAKHAVEEELQHEVKIDCEVGEWSKFGKCSALCDGGKMTRKREVSRQPQNGGTPCPMLSNEVECNTDSCASEAYQRRATRRKLTAHEKKLESLKNNIKVSQAMRSP